MSRFLWFTVYMSQQGSSMTSSRFVNPGLFVKTWVLGLGFLHSLLASVKAPKHMPQCSNDWAEVCGICVYCRRKRTSCPEWKLIRNY